jgi:hypothetical protein
MLRFFVILLLLANGLFYAWSNGFLAPWTSRTESASEPQRLTAQIEPERIVVLPNAAANKPPLQAVTAAPTVPVKSTPIEPPSVCLTSGVFDTKQVALLKQLLADKLSNVPWRFEAKNTPAVWIVYMGKYLNNNARDLKKSQLDQIKVKYETLAEKQLEPGLSLGSYASQAAASQALQQLVKQGVRTARVLQEFPEQKGELLVIPAIDETNRAKLNTAYAAVSGQLGNKVLKVCSK